MYISGIDQQYTEYAKVIQKFKDALIAEVQKIGHKVYVCAISRKMPRLLQLLDEDIEPIKDKICIISEFALPYLKWENINEIILIDDAIYYGSTFSNIYKLISAIKEGINIIPMCCVKAAEAPQLVFEEDLRAERKPRSFSHFFVNKLSRDFHKLSSPFEIEYPVFEGKAGSKLDNTTLSSPLFQEFGRKVVSIPYRVCLYTDNYNVSNEDGNEEYSVMLDNKPSLIKKLRFYRDGANIKAVPMLVEEVAQIDLDSNNLVANESPEYVLWQTAREGVTCGDNRVTEVKYHVAKSGCMWYNFIQSLKLWKTVQVSAIRTIGQTAPYTYTLSKQEFVLLFGDELAEKLYNEANRYLKSDVTVEISSSQEYIEDEVLPSNFQFASFYKNQQKQLLALATSQEEALSMIFYLQNVMLDKMNRTFFMLDGKRLQYGSTFGSLFRLLKTRTGQDVSKDLLLMHQWIDSYIDRATIVPQYIRINEGTADEKWVRLLRSGENEVPVISHWARFYLMVFKLLCTEFGTKEIKINQFQSLVSIVLYHNPGIASMFYDIVRFKKHEGYYFPCLGSLGEKEYDILEALVRFGIFKYERDKVSLPDNILDVELNDATTIFPVEYENNLKSFIKKLVEPIIEHYMPTEVMFPYFQIAMSDCPDVEELQDSYVYNNSRLAILAGKIIETNDFSSFNALLANEVLDLRTRYSYELTKKFDFSVINTTDKTDFALIYQQLESRAKALYEKRLTCFDIVMLCLIPQTSSMCLPLMERYRSGIMAECKGLEDEKIRKKLISIISKEISKA